MNHPSHNNIEAHKKLQPKHGLQLIHALAGNKTATELGMAQFLQAVRDERLYHVLETLKNHAMPMNISVRDAILSSAMERNLFASSFVFAIHFLLMTHAPVSERLFLFYSCRDIGGRHYMRADYNIQCYNTDWWSFQPFVLIVMLSFTIGFPLVLITVLYVNRKRLYQRSLFAKIGFLYERYSRKTEWWEVHEMMRKITLTGLLLFVSQRIMVRSVLATVICIVMCINLNYFKPHRNMIVFWVEQAANLSSTLKYLVAIIISTKVTAKDQEMLGNMLVGFDIIVLLVSLGASTACFYVLRTSLKDAHKHKHVAIHPTHSGGGRQRQSGNENQNKIDSSSKDRLTQCLRNSDLARMRMSELQVAHLRNYTNPSEHQRIDSAISVKSTLDTASKHSEMARRKVQKQHTASQVLLRKRLEERRLKSEETIKIERSIQTEVAALTHTVDIERGGNAG